jgi:hypothetical protein
MNIKTPHASVTTDLLTKAHWSNLADQIKKTLDKNK